MAEPKLLMLPTATVALEPDGRYFLDTKFVTGMQTFSSCWGGPIDCIMRESTERFAFGRSYDPEEVGFGLKVVPPGVPVDAALADDYDIVLLSADDHLDLGFAAAGRGRRARIAYAIEYTLETRLRIALFDRSRNLPKRLWSCLWNIRQEVRRRSALKAADGIQANGYPALAAYSSLNNETLLYLDNRMTPELFATGAEMAARENHFAAGGPLRLVNSGRLDPLKGAQDLVPIARMLEKSGVDFTLDIFGAGSLAEEIAREIVTSGLGNRVRLHEPVDFATVLVPFSRTGADVFLSCHRQADPSCTYVEAMGCGLPVVGYANEMLAETVRRSRSGWTVPLGNAAALARRITELAQKPESVLQAGKAALEFARAHDFDGQFALRIEQLQRLARASA